MDAGTYPAKEVVNFINNYITPLRINIKNEPVHDKYQCIWTPTLAVLDLNGDEVQRTIGFLDPVELIASLHLGIAKVRLDAGEHDTANVHLKTLLDKFQDSTMVPEAIYFKGVNSYKWHNDPSRLKAAHDELLEKFPGTTWAKRAHPYRLI